MGVCMRRRVFLSATTVACSLSAGAFAQSGIPAGGLDLNVGIRFETGFDSNPFYANSDSASGPQGSGVVNINPYLGLRTAQPRMLALDGALGLKWEQYLANSDDNKAASQSGPDIEGNLGLRINPRGLVSVRPSDRLVLSNEPSYNANGDPTRALYNDFGLEVGFHPGGADNGSRVGFSGEVRFVHQLAMYVDPSSDDDVTGRDAFNNAALGGEGVVRYNFLPKTSVFLMTSVRSVSYAEDTSGALGPNGQEVANSDSLPMRFLAGFNGLLAPRFSLLATMGYGGASYDLGESASTVIGQVEAGLDMGEVGNLNFGWERNIRDAIVANFVTMNRFYGRYTGSAGDLNFGFGAEARLSSYSSATAADGSEFEYWETDGEKRTDTSVRADAELGYGVTDWLTVGGRYAPVMRFTDAKVAGTGDASIGFTNHRAFVFLALHDIFRRPAGLSGVSGAGSDDYGLR